MSGAMCVLLWGASVGGYVCVLLWEDTGWGLSVCGHVCAVLGHNPITRSTADNGLQCRRENPTHCH